MPSVSKKQHNLMAAVANNPKFAKKVGIPKSVGEDFMEADKGKKFRTGGSTNPSKGKFNKPRSNHGMMQLPNVSLEKYVGKKEGGTLKGKEMKESKMMVKKEIDFMKKKGAPKSMLKHEMAEAGMNNGGKVKKMAMGGQAGASMDPRKAAMIAQMMKAKRSGARPGMAPAAAPAPMTGMKKGGAVFTKSADGIAKRGKTQGAQVKMAMGGSAKKYC